MTDDESASEIVWARCGFHVRKCSLRIVRRGGPFTRQRFCPCEVFPIWGSVREYRRFSGESCDASVRLFYLAEPCQPRSKRQAKLPLMCGLHLSCHEDLWGKKSGLAVVSDNSRRWPEGLNVSPHPALVKCPALRDTFTFASRQPVAVTPRCCTSATLTRCFGPACCLFVTLAFVGSTHFYHPPNSPQSRLARQTF